MIEVSQQKSILMALDELTATIERIKRHINSDHRASFTSSETRTRQVLIDPLLSALGWDVTDPSLVELEYDVLGKRADYALKREDGKPVVVIEAKSFGEQLIDDDTMEVLNYANWAGIGYVVVSNGSEWRMYDVFWQAQLEDRLITELNIETLPSRMNALKSLPMWQPILRSVSEPVVADDPFPSSTVADDSKDFAQIARQLLSEQDERAQSIKAEIGNAGDVNTGWLGIADPTWTATGRKPSAIKIDGVVHQYVPDSKKPGEMKQVTSWADLTQLIGIWLIRTDKLKREDCPVSVTRGKKRCLVNIAPRHPDGTPFISTSSRPLIKGMWIETGHGAIQHVGYAVRLFRKFGVDPDTVMVKVE